MREKETNEETPARKQCYTHTSRERERQQAAAAAAAAAQIAAKTKGEKGQ